NNEERSEDKLKGVLESNVNNTEVNNENKRVEQVFKRASANRKESKLESKMETEPIMVDVQVNDVAFEEALVDTGNTCLITISEENVRKLQVPTKKLPRPHRV
ncbi:hypothetical protein OnM2_027093, partial [Erysiphe neolycopersici]